MPRANVYRVLGAEWRLNIVRKWKRMPSVRAAYIRMRRSGSRVVTTRHRLATHLVGQTGG